MAKFNKEAVEQAINEALVTLAASERVTKDTLGELSRTVLSHFVETRDPVMVNKLLGVNDVDGKFILTPLNWRRAAQYFYSFVPHSSNYKDIAEYVKTGKGERVALEFGGKNGNRGKAVAQMLKAKTAAHGIKAWLADESATIWTWEAPEKVSNKSDKSGIAKAAQAMSTAMSILEKDSSGSTEDLFQLLANFETLRKNVDAIKATAENLGLGLGVSPKAEEQVEETTEEQAEEQAA